MFIGYACGQGDSFAKNISSSVSTCPKIFLHLKNILLSRRIKSSSSILVLLSCHILLIVLIIFYLGWSTNDKIEKFHLNMPPQSQIHVTQGEPDPPLWCSSFLYATQWLTTVIRIISSKRYLVCCTVSMITPVVQNTRSTFKLSCLVTW